MAGLTLRIRHDGHAATLVVPKETTVAELQELISAETGVAVRQQLLRIGVPPRVLPLEPSAQSLLQLGCCDRDTVLVEGTQQSREGTTESSPERCLLPVREEPSAGSAGQGTKKRRRPEGETGGDLPESELLPAFDRAIAAASAHAKMLPEDKHQVWALRRGKAAVIESLKRGDDISLGVLHTLKGVGHWVVQQVRDHLEDRSDLPTSATRRTAQKQSKAAPPPTPQSFTWWYLGKNGKAVDFRNDAEVSGFPGQEQFRVCISHASGRVEKAWLPDAKAPPRSQGTPPQGRGSGGG